MAEKKSNIKKKAKSLFKTVKDTLVQEDNPNSPHLVFSRMNENILGDAPASPRQEKEDIDRHLTPLVSPPTGEKNLVSPPTGEKKKTVMLTPEQFDELIWGRDDK